MARQREKDAQFTADTAETAADKRWEKEKEKPIAGASQLLFREIS
ncbi:MAG: hypothetical protein WAM14_26690 [Candidatus Nitrosopolaris sp.]